MNTRKLLVAALGLTALIGSVSIANAEPVRRVPVVAVAKVHHAKVRHVSFSHKALAERRRVALKHESRGAKLAQAKAHRDARAAHRIG